VPTWLGLEAAALPRSEMYMPSAITLVPAASSAPARRRVPPSMMSTAAAAHAARLMACGTHSEAWLARLVLPK
jgi:hypothetical protein